MIKFFCLLKSIPKMKTFVVLVLQLFNTLVFARERFDEKLILKTHSRGHVSSYFNFKTFVPVNIDLPWVSWNSQTNTDLFPLSLLRLLQTNNVQELHLSMVQGKWRYDKWGLPPRDSPAKTQLSVWFNTFLNANHNWQRVLSHLSGQFCASLNQIKPHITVKPKFSFRPFVHNHSNVSHLQKYSYHAMLPQEVVCTENLTPWAKLLPCKSQKGLADLFVATKLLNTLFFSLSLDFKYSCSDVLNCQQTQGIELNQNILVVFDPITNGKPNFDWSIRSLFGSPLSSKSYCPLATSNDIFIQLLPEANLTIVPQDYVIFDRDNNRILKTNDKPTEVKNVYAHYDVKQLVRSLDNISQNQKYINIAIEYPKESSFNTFFCNHFHDIQVRRSFRGTGQIWAGLTTTIVNRLKVSIYMTYLDTIPWYFRMYLHTLIIRVRSLNGDEEFTKLEPKHIYYQPAKTRESPHHLEVILELPPESEVEIDFELERQFLRWTEYPPDSSHGLYISPGTLTFYNTGNLSANLDRFAGVFFDNLQQTSNISVLEFFNERLFMLSSSIPVRIYTDPILINMPTPDFSMPFNVICFVSTVISIAFGPFFNITTNRAKVIDEKKSLNKENLGQRIKRRVCVIM